LLTWLKTPCAQRFEQSRCQVVSRVFSSTFVFFCPKNFRKRQNPLFFVRTSRGGLLSFLFLVLLSLFELPPIFLPRCWTPYLRHLPFSPPFHVMEGIFGCPTGPHPIVEIKQPAKLFGNFLCSFSEVKLDYRVARGWFLSAPALSSRTFLPSLRLSYRE